MKRFLFLLVFCAMGFHGISRSFLLYPKPGIHNQHADQRAYMFSAGYFQGNFNQLNNYIHRFGNSAGFSPFFATVGMDWIVPAGGRYGEHNATFPNPEIILPQEVSAGDSVKFRMMGWHFITSLWSYDALIDNPKLALEFAPGMDWGELYIKQTDGSGTIGYHNPFIAPLVRTEFRVVLAPIAFGIRASYRYDVSSPRWKSNADDNSGLADSRISGLGFQVFLGWGKTIKE